MTTVRVLYSNHAVGVLQQIGGNEYIYTQYGNRVMITSRFWNTDHWANKHLEKLAIKLDEGMAVHKINKAKLKPYSIAVGGHLFIAHKKGHDYYVFNLNNNRSPVSVNWTTDVSGVVEDRQIQIATFVLVGEGNILRNVRRWLRYRLKTGSNNLDMEDIKTIKERSHDLNFNILLITTKGYVLDLGSSKMITHHSKPNHLLQVAMNGWAQVIIASGCKLGVVRSVAEVMLNETHLLGNS